MSHKLSRRSAIAAGLALGAAPVVGAALASPAAAAAPGRKPLIGPAPRGQLHVMTYNIRYAHEQPPNSWAERRPVLANLLRIERPTVIGTQEGLYHQLQDVPGDQRSYDWISLHREGGSQGEAMAVLFDTNRLKPIAYDHLWLSDTPRLIGSKSWGNNVIRMLTWVRFVDKSTGKQFVLLNTHFDHESEPSRQRSATMVRDTVGTFDVPVIVTGDFNSRHDTSAAYQILVTDGGLVDTWTAAREHLTPAYGTFNFWDPAPQPDGDRIDWILTTAGITTNKVAVNTYSEDGQCPSDHWPVQAVVTLP